MFFLIADDSDNDVDILIVFGGKSSLHFTEEANIDAINRAFHPPRTVLVSEEEYF